VSGERFLVLGCGSIGKRHIRNLLELEAGHVLAFDPRPDRREEAAELGAQSVATLDEGWAAAPQVVLVATPPSTHVPLAFEAADRGCNLFVEKPLAHSWDGVEELVGKVRGRGLVSLVGCNLRFHPGLRELRRLLDEGAIGRVLAFHVEFGQYLPDWHPWEDYRETYSARAALGGGVVLDAIHELDYATWLLGPVRAVFAFAGRLSSLEIDTEDLAAILLRFESEAIGEVHLDYVQRAYRRACRIVGEEGSLEWDFAAGVRSYSAASGQWRSHPLAPEWEINTMYLDELGHLLRCLRCSEEPALDVEAAAAVLRVALAARVSAASGQIVDPSSDAAVRPLSSWP
jgi:predicted dehydrogenase